ncbi:MAG: amidohydrolase [Prevotellaceae bacterium]|nr:amidohydrolase [Prevotellaceae bacterium]
MSDVSTLLRVSLLQTDILWEEKRVNLSRLKQALEGLQSKTDVVFLPEMFSTGFSMDTRRLAEPTDGETVTRLTAWAAVYGIALAGSYIARQEQDGTPAFYNRAFFITPGGEAAFLDKRHLFRIGYEKESYSAGSRRDIIRYKGWNIRLLVCYDLRFPVWSRNVQNGYDLLVYVANWPASRRKVWDALLPARALENQCYLCGVNRVGTDGNNLPYSGGSVVYSPKGEVLASVPDNVAGIATATIDLEALQAFRGKFPVWKDADKFTLDTGPVT